MRIEANIEYWDDNVLTFDPEKVIGKLRKYFPQTIVDPKDYSMDELERFIKYANDNVSEPNRSRVIASMRGKNWANGPTFRFRILGESEREITGYAKRYCVAFESKQDIDFKIEKAIIEFLKSLKYGEIRSNTQTKHFCKPQNDFRDYWLVDETSVR